MPTSLDDQTLQYAKNIALQAGRLLLQKQEQVKALSVKEQEQAGLLTDADIESETFIREAFERRFPDWGIISEESADKSGNEYTWVVDPLDGTHNYVRGHMDFSVSIGLTHQDEPVAGVIYLPARDELVSASKNQGAFLKEGRHNYRLCLSDIKWPVGIFSVSSNIDFKAFDCRAIVDAIQRAFIFQAFRRRVIESSALELCYVARGIYDAHINFYAQPWDVVAGAVIVAEAGGAFSWIPVKDGRPHALASHQAIHEALKSIIS